jgi:hypothetical protein
MTGFNALWGKWIDGAEIDYVRHMTADSAGNIYIAGQANNALQAEYQAVLGAKPGSTTYGAFVMKLNASGVAQWGKWIDGTGTDNAAGIAVDAAGNVYVSGSSTANFQSELATLMGPKPVSTTYCAFILKFNSSGVAQWGNWIDGSGSDLHTCTGIVAVDSEGNVYVTGNAVYIVKYNSSGAVQWVKLNSSNNSISYGIALDSDNNLYITGIATGNFQSELSTLMGAKSGGGVGVYFLKYNSSGVPQWGTWINDSIDTRVHDIAIDAANNVYIAGDALGNFQPDLHAIIGAKPVQNVGTLNRGAFLIKYNSSGVVQWGKWVDGEGGERGLAVATDAALNVYFAGSMSSTPPLEFASLIGTRPSTNYNGFLIKYNSSGIAQAATWMGEPAWGDLSLAIDGANRVYISASTTGNFMAPGIETKPTSDVGGFIIKYEQTIVVPEAPTGGGTTGGGGTTSGSLITPIPVEVNFEVTIEGDSALSIFGQAATTVENVLVAEKALPVNALYDATNKKGLIEFWEPLDDPNRIYARLANTNSSTNDGSNFEGAYKVTLKQLAKGLQRVLCYPFNCIGVAAVKAKPFDDPKYAGKEEYTTQRDFGRVALACFAHYLFGHVDATAAITNDVAFVKSMLSLAGSGADAAVVKEVNGGADRYAAYSAAHLDDINNKELGEWGITGGSTDANLAKRLTATIVSKGLVGGVVSGGLETSKVDDPVLTTDEQKKAKLAYIVAQVAGQDATRLMNEDNSERALNQRQLLRFYEGDIIYVKIKLLKPTVSVVSSQAVTSSALEGSYDSNMQTYTLKITLGAAETL